MDFLNVNIPIKNKPVLDEGFVPLGLFFKHFQENATKPVVIAVERSNGLVGRYDTKIFGTEEMKEADCYYIDRLVKMLLWAKGGFKVYVCGDETVGEYIKETYRIGGKRNRSST